MMESPNSLFIEYLTQLKKSAEEKGNQNGAKIYRKCISRHGYGLMTRTTVSKLPKNGANVESGSFHIQ